MRTRDQLLQLLEEQPGSFLSGEEIAGRLGISRAAVCKAAKALRDQGLPIDAVTRRGYRLQQDADILSLPKIETMLLSSHWHLRLHSSLPSTNGSLRELAAQGAPEGTVILALQQTAGRGRMGRTFFSPENSGLYFSILLRPVDLSPAESLQLTTLAAGAMCLAIEEVTEQKPAIKWVNDIFLGDRKICGILTEASVSMETGMMESVVLGVGLNLYRPAGGFPPELESIAGELCQKPRKDLKNKLVGAFLNHFSEFYEKRNFKEAACVYRQRSLLTGKEILAGGKKARVLGINERCQLVVEYEDHTTQALSYGEVSIVNCK